MSEKYFPILLIALFISLQACTTAQPAATQTPAQPADTTSAQPAATVETVPYQPSQSRVVDLLHTRLELAFNWDKEEVYGKAQLQFAPYFYPVTQVVIDAKEFDFKKVELVTAEGRETLDYEYDGQNLFITLDTVYTKQDTFWVAIDYTAHPGKGASTGQQAISSNKGLYFIKPDAVIPDKPHQIWTQGEPESNSRWFPTLDQPNEKHTHDIYITVKKQFKTLSNGELIYAQDNGDSTRTDFWQMSKPHAPYLTMIAVGDFARVTEKWAPEEDPLKEIELAYYVEPAYEQYAKDIFAHTPEMMTFFSDKLGYNYPWPKYAQIVVRDYVSGAMENTTATVFMEDIQLTSRELIDEEWDYIIAHELFHHWFGDLVTCESWANLPLNESFANYSEYLWNEYKYGTDVADYHALTELENYLYESETKQVDLIRYYHAKPRDMFDSHSYSKGGLILHMLRKYIGDEAFFASLQHYLSEHEYESVEAHDLRLALEEITGEDMNWFFDQWFFSSGHPELQVTHSFSGDSLLVTVAQTQDKSNTPVYRLPLYIDVWTAENFYRYDVIVEEAYEEFYLPLEETPLAIVFDGEQQLVGTIEHEKIPEEYYNQYLYSDKFLPRYEALTYFSESPEDSLSRELLMLALDDTLKYIREAAAYVFLDFIGEGQPAVAEKMTELAKNDQASSVRAAALSVLATFDADQFTDLFKAGLNDSSYSVNGSALEGLLATSEDVSAEIEPYYADNHIDIILPLADAAVIKGQGDKFEWISEKLNKTTGQEKWYVLQYYNELLLLATEAEQEEAIPMLKTMAGEHEADYMRLGAMQGLIFLMEKYPTLENDIRKIMSEEKDETLQKLYEEFK